MPVVNAAHQCQSLRSEQPLAMQELDGSTVPIAEPSHSYQGMAQDLKEKQRLKGPFLERGGASQMGNSLYSNWLLGVLSMDTLE